MLFDNVMRGIDVSSNEMWRKYEPTGQYGYVDLDYAAMENARVGFATVRKSFGPKVTDQDPGFNPTMQATQGKIMRQPYHWYKPVRGTSAAQAQVFMAGYVGGELPPLLDLENSGWQVAWKGIGVELLDFLLRVENGIGERPEIYTSPSYIMSYFVPADISWLCNYRFVMAHYNTAFPLVPQPIMPDQVIGWQFTDRAYAPFYGIPNPKGWGTIQQAALYFRFLDAQ